MSTRECPACAMETSSELDECEVCGYEFPLPKRGVRTSAWVMAGLMAGLVPMIAWLLGWFG